MCGMRGVPVFCSHASFTRVCESEHRTRKIICAFHCRWRKENYASGVFGLGDLMVVKEANKGFDKARSPYLKVREQATI